MNTTAGPQTYPKSSVFNDAGNRIAFVQRDPKAPHRWIALEPDTRNVIIGVGTTTCKGTIKNVQTRYRTQRIEHYAAVLKHCAIIGKAESAQARDARTMLARLREAAKNA